MEVTKVLQTVTIQAVRDGLKPIVAKVLRIPEAELSDNITLVDYGISSLMTIVLVQKINKLFGIQSIQEEIPINYSINSLSQLIFEKLNQASKGSGS